MAHLRAVHQQTLPQQQPTSRIKELEEEVRRLTVENAKVKSDLDKAQRRWERLKEGARRRRREGSNGATPEDGSIPEGTEKSTEKD
jgi:predicted RNase H-like nuclease (RuvC/YqgF family)